VRWIAVGAFVLLALAAATVGWAGLRGPLRLSKEVHSEREIRFLVRPLALPGNVNFASITVHCGVAPSTNATMLLLGVADASKAAKVLEAGRRQARPVNETANLCHKKWKRGDCQEQSPLICGRGST